VVSVLKFFVRLGRKVVDKIDKLLDAVADDPVVQRGVEADLGLPPGALNKVKATQRPDLGPIDDYVKAAKPTLEERRLALEAIKAYVKFWTTVFEAAQTDDPSIVLDELLYRLFQFATVDLLKYDHPTGYAVMRVAGIVQQDLRLTLEETFAPEVPANMFTREYWTSLPAAFAHGYHNFRLDQAPDFVLADADDPQLPPDRRTELRQLQLPVFARSDAGFGGVALILWSLGKWVLKDKDRDPRIEHLYGWELPRAPQRRLFEPPPTSTGIPLPAHIASRADSVRVSTAVGADARASATLTQLLLVDEEDRLGWLLSLRGAVTFEEQAGPTERRVKITVTIDAPDGLAALIRFSGDDQFTFTGAPSAAMHLLIRPVQAAAAAPAIALPDAEGTRLEIGDYSFGVDIAKEGFKLKASTKKSALVIDTGDGDAFVEDALGAKERRIEFDLGLTADQDGVSFDGGGKLSATIPLNATLGPLTVQTVQLALTPAGSATGSELAFVAATSFTFGLGPVKVAVEQIGFTVNVGSSSTPAPPDAFELASSLLYLRSLDFKPPAGLGIRIDGDFVSGGGFLFYDREKEEYAGVLQLELGSRFTFTAIGLLTTKLPEGERGYSFLIILSVELDPAWRIGPLAVSGLGGLFGLRRALDTDALRAGLRNRTLDAILFPPDPVTNAGRLIAALRTVFPPTKDKHVAGPILKLTWAEVVTAELALVFEWGASSRRALLGQLHAGFPPKLEQKLIQINIDALGIWDRDRGDFSLDARLYDSHIAFAHLTGDAALRLKSGDDAFFLFSIGGYHPEFNAPATFPKLERLTIKLDESANFRFVMRGYIALTTNTRQIGAELDLMVGFKGLTLEIKLSFDVLWEPDVRFLVDFDAELKIKYKGTTYFGASVSGRLTGPEPKHVQGEWTLDLWLFSITRPFEKTIGPDRPPAALPTVDPLADLLAALHDARNWSAPLPEQSRMLVGLRSRPGSPEVLVHPLGEIGVRQQLLPLGLELDRYAGGVPSGERRFTITRGFVGQDEVTDLRPANEQFAAADFLELTDDEKLHLPSFQSMPAGVTLTPKALAYGGQAPGSEAQAAVSEIDFEEIVVDADGNVVRKAAPEPLTTQLVTLAASFGPAARSELRAAGTARFAAPGPGFRVGVERYAVASVDNLSAVEIDGLDGQSQAAVRQALERHVKANPDARGTLQVVPAFQAEVPA
jgi:hypothetical protein